MTCRARYSDGEARWADDPLSLQMRAAAAIEINPARPRPGRYTCLPCQVTFTSFDELREHRAVCPSRRPGREHAEQPEPKTATESKLGPEPELEAPDGALIPRECVHCGRRFDDEITWAFHVRADHGYLVGCLAGMATAPSVVAALALHHAAELYAAGDRDALSRLIADLEKACSITRDLARGA